METITDKMIEYMNSCYESDKAATHSLMINRVPANQKLIDHPHAVCDSLCGEATIGTLGIINGFLSSINADLICMYWEDDKDQKIFKGFKRYEQQRKKDN